jgi:hypothetical protein
MSVQVDLFRGDANTQPKLTVSGSCNYSKNKGKGLMPDCRLLIARVTAAAICWLFRTEEGGQPLPSWWGRMSDIIPVLDGHGAGQDGGEETTLHTATMRTAMNTCLMSDARD